MSTLRIISDNAIARADTLTASSTASASLGVGNLLLDTKSLVHRATTNSVVYTATWADLEAMAGVALPNCNWSPTATIRVQAYNAMSGGAQVLDTGVHLACPSAAVKLRGWTAQAAASAYAYGGGALARIWFGQIRARRLVVTVVDTGSLDGYVEASRLVVGDVWSPATNADYGATLTFNDNSKHFRTDASDLHTDIGTRYPSLSLTLADMQAADRTALVDLLRGNGMAWPMLVSVLPGVADLELERDLTIYGKLSAVSALSLASYNSYSAPLQFDGS